MAKSQAHSKLLNQAAQEVLAPEGVFQKGRSRTWIDDHGWWIIVIEFQPSSWTKGSYLNVGASWLWHEKDYFSFDTDSRERPFIEYLNNDQFAPEARKLAELALRQTLALRRQFASVRLAAGFLEKRLKVSRSGGWAVFHAAISLGCVGEVRRARACFKQIEALPVEHPWHAALKDAAAEYAVLLDDRPKFLDHVRRTILKTRGLLKLPERSDIGLTPPSPRMRDG